MVAREFLIADERRCDTLLSKVGGLDALHRVGMKDRGNISLGQDSEPVRVASWST
jgi:hypothetical protein